MPYLQLRTSFLYLRGWCIKLGLLSKGKLFFLCFTPNCQDSLKPVIAPTQCQILMNRQTIIDGYSKNWNLAFTKYIEQSTPLGYHNISLKKYSLGNQTISILFHISNVANLTFKV